MDQHDATATRVDRKLEVLAVKDEDGITHATTGGAAAAGALTGGVIGLAVGPLGAAIGALGGAIVAAATERMMHSDDDSERAREARLDAPTSETETAGIQQPIS